MFRKISKSAKRLEFERQYIIYCEQFERCKKAFIATRKHIQHNLSGYLGSNFMNHTRSYNIFKQCEKELETATKNMREAYFNLMEEMQLVKEL